MTTILFIGLTAYAAYIYKKGGVVRDVPELYISKGQSVNHKAYNDKIYNLDKPFETNKKHWLVVGSSFGRDFSNVILESSIADSVEISYIYSSDYQKKEKADRFAHSDRVFFCSMHPDTESVRELESVCLSNGFPIEKLVIVGTKNFGESNGQIYAKRYNPDYFDLRVKMEKGYVESNNSYKELYGERYLDIIGLVIDEKGTMPVFTPDKKFVSQDCRHFSMGGAKWFATLIDWSKYLN